jgi:hypothetical protein
VIFACHEGGVGWWKQGTAAPELVLEIPREGLEAFLQEHTRKRTFEPQGIYRAKTQGRIDPQLKLSFVDEMLMPFVERSIGERLGEVVEEVFAELKNQTGPTDLTPEVSHQLLHDAFWLLAAKILRDKGVPTFAQLDLRDLDEVFRSVREHYGEPPQLLQRHPPLRRALLGAASRISRLSHLGQVTTESLAHVYETTLVTPELRRTLGIHSTPPYLVEYILGRLDRWIAQMDWEKRHVFEPACGHAAFLVAAMRRLREALPQRVDAHGYLQKHLHGLEVDPVAREIARLSLTLADVPNPDGWQLNPGDMFEGNVLQRYASEAMILLANPPFEDFTPTEQTRYKDLGSPVRHVNRAEEMLWRTLPHLPQGAVFGVIVPAGLLHSASGTQLREVLLHKIDLHEVMLLPDKMFTFATPETAIIIGRKTPPVKASVVRYRRVREADFEDFRDTFVARSDREIPQADLATREGFNLRIPDLEEVWRRTGGTTLDQLAHVGQGFTYRGHGRPKGARTWATKRFSGAVRGFLQVGRKLQIHGRPATVWMSLKREVIQRPRSGITTGQTQVVMNHHPVSRGPWRIKAIIDPKGYAVSGRFLVVRPRTPEVSPEFLWALCNSPYANAYAYTHSTKRHIEAGIMRKMPVPVCGASEIKKVVKSVRAYFKAMAKLDNAALRSPREEDRCRRLLLAMDALVLRLYDLPARLERELLDVFSNTGGERAGVPLPWQPYYPANFAPRIPLYVYLSATEPRKATSRQAKQARPRAEKRHALQAMPARPSTPQEIETEIDLLYEELAGLDVFRAEVGSTGELEARAKRSHQRLRELQKQQARAIAQTYHEQFLMPPANGPDLLDQVARLLEEHGDSARPHPTADAADREET